MRGARRSLVVLLSVLAASCAPKRVAPPTVVTPKYPDYVVPAAPDGVGGAGDRAEQEIGWQYLQAGDLKTSDRTFSAIVRRAPQFFPAEAGLGYVALARKDAPSAVSHFDKALTAQAGYAPALAGKGEALLALGRTDAALASFEAAATADPSLSALRSRVDVLRFRETQQEIAAARKAGDAGHYDESRRAYEAAIAASPDSAFLYRELAAVENRASDYDAALNNARRATTLDPSDERAFVLTGEIYESRQQWTQAAEAYAAAGALDPSDPTVAARADAMRAKIAFDTMPLEYRELRDAPTVTRAQLAALVGVRLESLLRGGTTPAATVVTDTRGSWAATWILLVTRAGVMEVYANHTFHPDAQVRRADLAAAVSRILGLLAEKRPQLASRWREGRPAFTDLPPGHLDYPAAARAVSAGVMSPAPNGAFELSRPVSGREAMDAVDKIEALAQSAPR